MRVIRADVMGLCFGVRDALQQAAGLAAPDRVTIHGELVHNEIVLTHLDDRGFHQSDEKSRQAPTTPDVLITAHGVSDRERDRLAKAGKRLIDTTCPLVRRVHEAAQRLATEGCHIIVIGRAGHVEVRGVVEDLPACDVVGTPEEVRCWPHPKLGVVCQTTTPPRLAEQIHQAVRTRNPHAEIHFEDTVCQPTRDRQLAVERLCRQVDALVVVGGSNSNNTRQLAELCRRHGTRAYQVQSAADVKPDWFRGCQTVGLTAGTSTLDETIEEVFDRLTQLREKKGRENRGEGREKNKRIQP